MTTYHQFHVNLLKIGYNNLLRQPPFNEEENYIPEAEDLLALFQQVISGYEHHDADAFSAGQTLMTSLVRGFPQFTQLLARDLLWLFGGDCIHYLSDDEIEQFQALDEARYALEAKQEPYDYLELRNALLSEPATDQH